MFMVYFLFGCVGLCGCAGASLLNWAFTAGHWMLIASSRAQGQGTGPRVQSPGHKPQGTGPRVQSPGHRPQGAGPRVQSPGCRPQGAGPRVQSPGRAGSSRCGTQAWLTQNMWGLPGLGIELVPLALQDRFLTTALPEKPNLHMF